MASGIDAAAGLDEVARHLDAFLDPDADPGQARKRRLILNAATELFIAYGYRKTTIEDIAGAAGVAKGTVYLYYRNKAELLLHAIALQKRQYLSEMAPIFDPSRPARERLRVLIVLSIRLSHEMPLLTRFSTGDRELLQVLEEVDPSTLQRITETRMGFAADLLDEATGRSWPRDTLERRAHVLMDLVFGAVHGGRLVRDGMPLDEYARELADVVVDGLLHRGSDRADSPARASS